ncbi:putative manganese-dependent inorganic diphosphatase [Holdemanella sp. SCCA2]|nr:putative manganese-dependent inorganic diphosphatase [Holdemanella sp. SCCA2]
MNGKVTYIFGHKNPDTDSICASIALSYLKNKLGFNAVASTLGNLNPETKFALNYFNVKEPYHLNDVKLQIKDVSYHKGCFIDKNVPIKDAFDYMNKYSLTGIPVVENKNKYYGYVSLKEVAREIINGDFHKINTSYGNLISVLKGTQILKFDKEISGNVLAATYAKATFLERVALDNSYILIIGDRTAILDYAIESKVKLIIVIAGIELPHELLQKAKKNKVNIISTPLSSYEVGKLISFSNYIKDIMRKEESVTFNELDYLSDFIEQSKKLKHTNYPILNSKNECKGLLTLTDTNNVDKKQVILVDHNNSSQSVDGLEESEILEVIDHHNIGDINTKKPINFRNAGVGSVNTIIYDLYKENNIKIPKDIAGLMASAIISDTLLLTSPTTTIRDTDALINLSKIAKIKYKKYGIELLKQGMTIKGLTNEDILHKDFKTYKVNDKMIGIGQILTADFESMNKKINSLVNYLDEVSNNENIRVVTLFVTDIFENVSYCLYNRDAENIIKNSFDLKEIYEGVPLKDIVSRKIQIAPYIMDAIEKE